MSSDLYSTTFSTESLGAIYLTTSKTWESRFEELVYFRQENGHCNVPRNHGPLGNWVQKQRLAYKLYNSIVEGSDSKKPTYSSPPSPLSKEQVQLLDSVGFIWDVHEYRYQCNLDELKEFYVRHMRIDVPSSLDGEYRTLYKWVCRQKDEYRKYLDGEKSKLTKQRRDALENLGFHVGMFDFEHSDSTYGWYEPKRVSWDGRFQQLLHFKEEYGHCNVPTKTNEKYSNLSNWVQHQRAEKKKKNKGLQSRLTDEKDELLEGAGFIWSSKELNWSIRLNDLREYKEIHGHCNVPTKEGELGGWVMTQRLQHGKNSLSQERVAALNELGFIWKCHDLAWNDKYTELCQHMNEKGSEQLVGSGPLNAWIATQRAEKRYKNNGLQTHLTDERERQLNEIGFDWNVNEDREKTRHITWMRNFDRLKQHIEETGSSQLRIASGGDGFAVWVRDQRRYLKTFENGIDSPMTPERRDLLASIGFNS